MLILNKHYFFIQHKLRLSKIDIIGKILVNKKCAFKLIRSFIFIINVSIMLKILITLSNSSDKLFCPIGKILIKGIVVKSQKWQVNNNN